MPFFTYIIYSPTRNKYYVGETENLELRLNQHNTAFFPGKYTVQAKDWELFLSIEFNDRTQARKFESFIKKMKSRKFIESLKSDQTKLLDLKQKFS